MKKKILVLSALFVAVLVLLGSWKLPPYYYSYQIMGLLEEENFAGAQRTLEKLENSFPAFAEKRRPKHVELRGLIELGFNNPYRASAFFSEFLSVRDSEESDFANAERLIIASVFTDTDKNYQAIKLLQDVQEGDLGDRASKQLYHTVLAQAYFGKHKENLAREHAELSLSFGDESAESRTLAADAHLILALTAASEEEQVSSFQAFASSSEGIDLNFFSRLTLVGMTPSEEIEELLAPSSTAKNIGVSPLIGAVAYTELASRARVDGDFDVGMTFLDQAIAAFPDYFPAYHEYSRMHQDQGDFETGYAYYEKMRDIDSFHFRAYNGMGWMLYELTKAGQRTNTEYAQALSFLQKAIEYDPEYSRSYNTIGTIYIELGDLQKAIDNFRRALEFEQYAKPYLNLALAYAALEDFETAQKYLIKAVELEPELMAFVNQLMMGEEGSVQDSQ